MHIPPYYKKESWQRFFVGVFIGALISYFVFIFMYGTMYERLLEKNLMLQSKLTEVENHNKALLEDKEELDERSKKPVTVESIELTITNAEELRLDKLIIHQLEELIKEEISTIVGQDVYIVSESDELLSSTIENKSYKVDDFSYRFEVKKLTISRKIKINVEAKISS